MTPTLHGDRIILRSVREADRGVFEADKDAEFLRMVGANREDAETSRQAFDEALTKPFHWAVTVDGRCIGIALLHSLVENDKRARYAVGIFQPRDWSKGFGTETTRLVLGHAFNRLGLHRVDVRVLEYNRRGLRCYEKCGFVREGSERESAYVDGRWYNDVILGILAHEYLAVHSRGERTRRTGGRSSAPDIG